MAQTFRISQWRKSKVNYISALISRQITATATLFAANSLFHSQIPVCLPASPLNFMYLKILICELLQQISDSFYFGSVV